MSRDFCRGCGTVLQSQDPDKPGYVPEAALARKGALICKRCFRIKNYGDIGAIQPGSAQIKNSITKATATCDLLMIVVDFSDITGTLPVWTGFLGDKPYLLLLNKIDLLPLRTKPDEVKEYIQRYLADAGWPKPRDLFLVSGLKGGGIERLTTAIVQETKAGAKIGLLGVTNVGKSSVINQLLSKENSGLTPTVSKYPGTTVGLSNWSILNGRNTIVDTPGLVPGDRIGDLLCPNCASLLTPTVKMEQKLLELKAGKGLVVGGLMTLENIGAEAVVVIIFTAPEIILHQTDNSRIEALLVDSKEWLARLCSGCRQKLTWTETELRLAANSDLAIAGLGWVSIRGAGGDFRFRIPAGIRWEKRPALVGKK